MNKKFDCDVIIVGAGASGIYAASTLKKAGLSSIILEAGDNLGGRLKSKEISKNTNIELGGQWLAKNGQIRLSELVDRFGFKKIKNYNEGKSIIWKGKVPLIYKSKDIELPLMARLDVWRFSLYIKWKLKSINIKKPWKNSELDKTTAHTWLSKKLWTNESRKFVFNIFEQAECCDLSEFSILEGLCNLKTIGSLKNFQDADYYYFKEGLQNLLARLALEDKLDISYNHEVTHIKQGNDQVEVYSKNKVLLSKAVLVTVPLPTMDRINFEPQLPSAVHELCKTIVRGHAVKVVAVYDSPWWRTEGYSGTINDPDGLFDLVIDSSPDSKYGVLVGLVTGPRANNIEKLESKELQRLFTKYIERSFGHSQLPISFNYFNWGDYKYALGAYSARRAINQWTKAKDCLQQPFQRVYFAGTETALEWRGYVEGALESGERQGQKIATMIKKEFK
jgi:monoamine oxidase